MQNSHKQLLTDKEYIISELKDRFEGQVEEKEIPDDIKFEISEIEQCADYIGFTDILNRLLINPNHRSHQYIAKLLQEIKSPTSIWYIRQVLNSGFDYLEYTCSESNVIAKWFSWALASIGTSEAIDTIREFTESEDEGIREEMIYRLNKIGY